MPLETATTISELFASYPLGGDVASQGDDHLRLLKAVLKSQFPGALGDGLSSPVDVTEIEFGYLVGVTSPIQDQFGAFDTRLLAVESTLNAPIGTRLAFHQASAPLGWAQDSTVNDSMLRVVSGVGGGADGTDSPILNDKIPSHTHVIAENGGHTHLYDAFLESGGNAFDTGVGISRKTIPTQSAGVHTHTMDANVGGANWTPKYHDMIICAKE